jgi:hypothetical protein
MSDVLTALITVSENFSKYPEHLRQYFCLQAFTIITASPLSDVSTERRRGFQLYFVTGVREKALQSAKAVKNVPLLGRRHMARTLCYRI